jgi:hypothetical protein
MILGRWNIHTGKEVNAVYDVPSIAISFDDKYIAASNVYGTIGIYRKSDTELMRAIQANPDGDICVNYPYIH